MGPYVCLMPGDGLDVLSLIADGSVDAIICDPPYGTTGVACKNLKGSFIGIEKDPHYFKVTSDRIGRKP